MENSSSDWAVFLCQKQNSDISRQNSDNYYSVRIIYCSMPLLKNDLEDLMMKLKKVMMGCVNAMAMMMVQTANSACIWSVHQSEFQQEAEKLKMS